MKPTIVIRIVDGILFPNTPDVHSGCTLYERNRENELSTLTQIHFLEKAFLELMPSPRNFLKLAAWTTRLVPWMTKPSRTSYSKNMDYNLNLKRVGQMIAHSFHIYTSVCTFTNPHTVPCRTRPAQSVSGSCPPPVPDPLDM